MRVLAHIDPVVLERELLSHVAEAHPPGQISATLIVTPTRRLAEHLLRRLPQSRPGWLGLEVLHFRSLAFRILERQTGRSPFVASSRVLEALLQRILRERPSNPWAATVQRRPGSLRGLLRALNDLREACVEPDALEVDDDRDRALGELFEAYDRALATPETSGWTDDAGLIRAALPHAAAFGESLRSLFLHGAYELIGSHLDLLRELDRSTAVSAFVPVEAGSRVTAYAEAFARDYLLAEGARCEPLGGAADDPRRRRLAALYDEAARPEPAPPATFGFRHAQGPAAEVKFAVREVLRAVREGCPPTEIVVTARSLAPYAAALEEAFEDAGLPWTSSLASPLRRHGVVRDFLLLLRVLGEGYPRDRTVELMRSTRIDWSSLGCDGPPRADLADRYSRDAGVVDGLESWTRDLPAWADRPDGRPAEDGPARARAEAAARRRSEEADSVARVVQRLDAAFPREDATWGAHAERLSALVEATIVLPTDASGTEALEHLQEILQEMGRLERLVGDRRTIGFDAMRAWLETAVDGEPLTLHRQDRGGVRVIDAAQLRGLTFERVQLLGMNSGLFPRAPREDPILPDALRRSIRERTGRPLGIRSRGPTEERLLLGLVVGAARERVDVSWQRADESGRAKIASLALRELARLALGSPDMDRLREQAQHLPSHPTQWLQSLHATGLLAPEEDRILAALSRRDEEAIADLGERFPELGPGLRMLRATQSFVPVDPGFDGRIGAREEGGPLSVSRLESLGRCPQQFFFGSVLRVSELEARPSLFEIERRQLGNLVHAVLERIYTSLHEERRFDDGSADDLVRRGRELLEQEREGMLGEVGRRNAARLPHLWDLLADRWFDTLGRFLDDDLRRLRKSGLRPVSFEDPIVRELDFSQGVRRPVSAKFDRCFEGPEGIVVADYKTSNRLRNRVSRARMLKAETLQVPLYQMMAGDGATVELLAIHPTLGPADDEQRFAFSGFDKPNQGQAFRATMRVLYALHDAGVFPLKSGKHCDWCPFDRACRRNHPPTTEREKLMADSSSYRELGGPVNRRGGHDA